MSEVLTFDRIELAEFITLEATNGQLCVVYRVPATGAVLCTHRAAVEATQRIVHRGDAVEYGYLGLSVYEQGDCHMHPVFGVKEVNVVNIGGVSVPVKVTHDYRPSDDELVRISREREAEEAERKRAHFAQQLERLDAWLRTKQPTWFTAVRPRDIANIRRMRGVSYLEHLPTTVGGMRLLRLLLSPGGMAHDLKYFLWGAPLSLRPEVERIYFEAFEAAKQRKAAAKAAWLARKGGE